MSSNLDSFLEYFMKVKKEMEELRNENKSLKIDKDNLKREIIRLQGGSRKDNPYEAFREQMIITDKDSILSYNDLYDSFIEWFRETYPRLKVPSKLDIKNSFIEIFGELYKNKWIGIRLYRIEDEIHEIVLSDDDLQ